MSYTLLPIGLYELWSKSIELNSYLRQTALLRAVCDDDDDNNNKNNTTDNEAMLHL
jgi:hypothetical protein